VTLGMLVLAATTARTVAGNPKRGVTATPREPWRGQSERAFGIVVASKADFVRHSVISMKRTSPSPGRRDADRVARGFRRNRGPKRRLSAYRLARAASRKTPAPSAAQKSRGESFDDIIGAQPK